MWFRFFTKTWWPGGLVLLLFLSVFLWWAPSRQGALNSSKDYNNRWSYPLSGATVNEASFYLLSVPATDTLGGVTAVSLTWEHAQRATSTGSPFTCET